MKSHRIIISKMGHTPAREDSHFPQGFDVKIDIPFKNQREMLQFIELLHSDKLWLTSIEPKSE